MAADREIVNRELHFLIFCSICEYFASANPRQNAIRLGLKRIFVWILMTQIKLSDCYSICWKSEIVDEKKEAPPPEKKKKEREVLNYLGKTTE